MEQERRRGLTCSITLLCSSSHRSSPFVLGEAAVGGEKTDEARIVSPYRAPIDDQRMSSLTVNDLTRSLQAKGSDISFSMNVTDGRER